MGVTHRDLCHPGFPYLFLVVTRDWNTDLTCCQTYLMASGRGGYKLLFCMYDLSVLCLGSAQILPHLLVGALVWPLVLLHHKQPLDSGGVSETRPTWTFEVTPTVLGIVYPLLIFHSYSISEKFIFLPKGDFSQRQALFHGRQWKFPVGNYPLPVYEGEEIIWMT